MPQLLQKDAVVNGYRMLTPGTTASSGTAQWAFAEKSGKSVFLKQFLSPVWPRDADPGTEVGKQKRRQRCQLFEQRIKSIEDSLASGGDGGFLIRAIDFFLWEGHYYKVTDRIEPASINVAELDARQQLLVLLTVAYSLKMLHSKKGLVHADLKPDNIIIQRHESRFISKLIDFDASFFDHAVPPPDEIIGDQLFQAPEMLQYQTGTLTGNLPGQAVDVFAAGLIFHCYLTGQLPSFPDTFTYPAEALAAHAKLILTEPKQSAMSVHFPIIKQMLNRDAAERPSMEEVHSTILRNKSEAAPGASRLRFGAGLHKPSETPTLGKSPAGPVSSRLSIKGLNSNDDG
jgi:serine/threonine protein kinase